MGSSHDGEADYTIYELTFMEVIEKFYRVDSSKNVCNRAIRKQEYVEVLNDTRGIRYPMGDR